MDKVDKFLNYIISPTSKTRSSNTFNKAINNKLRANYHVIDLSERTLLQHGFNESDVEVIRKAYLKLKSTFKNWKGVEIRGDYIRVVSSIIYETGSGAGLGKKHTFPNPYTATGLVINRIMEEADSISSNETTKLRIGKGLVRGHLAGGESFRLRAAYRINIIEKVSRTPFHKEFKKQLYGKIGILTKYREKIEEFAVSGEKFNIVITLETSPNNATKAIDEQKLSLEVLTKVSAAFEQAIDMVTPNAVRRLLMARGSPSFIDKLISKFATAFLLKTNKLYNFYYKIFKTKRQPKRSLKTRDLFLEDNFDKTYRVESIVDREEDIDFLSLKYLLNNELPPAVKRNMGESTDPPVQLRYQTGRFANSSKITNITSTRKDQIEIFYTYMRYPYDVFLPWGRLYLPQRDPRTIIDKSIRDISKGIINARFNIKTELI